MAWNGKGGNFFLGGGEQNPEAGSLKMTSETPEQALKCEILQITSHLPILLAHMAHRK